jgi:uncharacterized membrane protein
MTAPTTEPVRRVSRHHVHTELPAKDPITVVAGPYGHPFHPILVTVPIGAWITSLVLDIGSRASDSPAGLARGAWWAIGVGVIGALAAAVFGLLDLLDIPRRTRAFRVGLFHMAINLCVVAAFVVSFFWRDDRGVGRETSIGQIVLSAVALLFLAVSGWLGGMLAYRYGVRVAAETDQAAGYRSRRSRNGGLMDVRDG